MNKPRYLKTGGSRGFGNGNGAFFADITNDKSNGLRYART